MVQERRFHYPSLSSVGPPLLLDVLFLQKSPATPLELRAAVSTTSLSAHVLVGPWKCYKKYQHHIPRNSDKLLQTSTVWTTLPSDSEPLELQIFIYARTV
ncbi:hypothetical protein EVAR_16280_1 [Eumeta japonica]|uniref:Uncharacterized protein n=1 Tax=Eumeta variegata TaxID=151549 RepID=A0A4C1U5Z5_EUMVA|nr:hypothetical protein EVAR_16280_1 [Eumeta japonica]